MRPVAALGGSSLPFPAAMRSARFHRGASRRRRRGHLDGNGTLLDITEAKTEAGERTLKLPKVLQPLLADLAKGKGPDDRLFGDVQRHWVLRSVKRCCGLPGSGR